MRNPFKSKLVMPPKDCKEVDKWMFNQMVNRMGGYALMWFLIYAAFILVLFYIDKC